jgi:hypothetical protein
MIDWDKYPNFGRDEFMCPCGCGRADMTVLFMNQLQLLRTAAGFGFPITSGFRCDRHDASIGGKGAHRLGKATDIRLFGERALIVLSACARLGFNRVGMMQHGPHDGRFIHLDTVQDDAFPSPWLWTYK